MTQLKGSAPKPRPVAVGTATATNVAYETAKSFGRVDENGVVWVKDNGIEREIGQFAGSIPEEPLKLYIQRYLQLSNQIELFSARLPHLSARDIDNTLASLKEQVEAPAAVGDLQGLREQVEALTIAGQKRKEEAQQEYVQAKALALETREALVAEAEKIAAQDSSQTQWKTSGQRLRELLDEWKQQQQNAPRLERGVENELWKRFSTARTMFEKNRRSYFAALDASQSEAKRVKQLLIKEAEKLANSTDWAQTSQAYRDLMRKWKEAGRASRREDEELWQQFRNAQQTFYDARQKANDLEDAEQQDNLKLKLELVEKAEALLPVEDIETFKQGLRPLQQQWDQIGRVPREDAESIEARMRAVEEALRNAEEEAWRNSNPEIKARAAGMAGQLQALIEEIEQELEQARAAGKTEKVKELEESLQARKAWLDQVNNF